MEAANDAYQIPSRKHLTTKMLPERSATIQHLILSNLQKAPVVCVTVDLWSNRQLRSYFGITAHFITSCDWDLKSVMLGRFRGSHTADAIMDRFQSVISEFDIFTKLTFTVTDSAANMIKAFSLPSFEKIERRNLEDEESDDDDDDDDENDDSSITDDPETSQFYDDLRNVSEHSPCFAHTLQLIIKDGFKQANAIVKVLKKASSIVSFVKKSTIATELLESEKSLKKDNATRWNSQLMMIKSILRIPEDTLNSLDTVHLSTYERKILEEVVEILTPFETATHCIQGDKVVTVVWLFHVYVS